MTATLDTRPAPRDNRSLLLLVLDTYPHWQPTPHALRRTTPAWCARCDQHWRLPFGAGGELCTPCQAAEYADREAGRR